MVSTALSVVLGRAVNVLAPNQLGVITDSLLKGNKRTTNKSCSSADPLPGESPWIHVAAFVGLRLLSGLMSWIIDRLWLPIEQYSYASMSVASYNHLMSLGYGFHTTHNPVFLQADLSKGRSGIGGLIRNLFFNFVPMVADVCFCVAYLYGLFGAYMALVVVITSTIYWVITAKMAGEGSDIRAMLGMVGFFNSHPFPCADWRRLQSIVKANSQVISTFTNWVTVVVSLPVGSKSAKGQVLTPTTTSVSVNYNTNRIATIRVSPHFGWLRKGGGG